MNQRRVVCAAIRNDAGDVILGIRHYSHDMLVQIANRVDGESFKHRHDADQGFVDQYGVYMTREEAFDVAAAANQIINIAACITAELYNKLYSEALY